MSRGGARKGAGRPKAKDGRKTQRTIYIPEDLADELDRRAMGRLSRYMAELLEREFRTPQKN